MKITLVLASMLCMYWANGQSFSEILKVSAFDREAEDRLGWAVDISGDYAIIGAYADDYGATDPNMGAAYIFEKTGIDDWNFVQKIHNSDQDDYDRFGWSVAIDGNLAVIGAFGEDEDENDENNLSKAGSAYIFERALDGTWNEAQKIVPEDREEGDQFGWTVDISGSTVIVGAHHEDHDALGDNFIFRAGSVYVFDRGIDSTWTQSQKVVAWDRQPDSGGGDETLSVWHYTDIDYGDLFGCSLSLSGDYMIVGAHNGDYNPDGVGGVNQAGAAYIFTRIEGTWVPDQKVCATIRSGWDRYGYSVAIDSNLAIVGAKAEDHSEFEADYATNAGSAYIYQRNEAGTWETVQKIDASDRNSGDHFGIDVSVDGDYIVVGAESNNFDEIGEDELNNSGAAYIFEKEDDGTWEEIQKIVGSDRRAEDWFANSIAISEHTIISGAWQQDFAGFDTDSIEDAGAGYFYSSIVCSAEFHSQSVNLCAGDSLTVGAHIYYEPGTYIDTLSNSDACDSIITTTLTFLDLIATEQELTICSGTSITVGGSIYNTTGEYLDTLIAVSGCDSLITTLLTVSPAIETEQEIALCFGETYTVGTSIYTENGTYLDSLTTESGCDSLITTVLTVEEDNIHEQNITLCAGETLTVGTSNYTENGTYEDTLTAASGCDSTVITNLTILPAINVSIDFIDELTLQGGDTDIETTTFQWITCVPIEEIEGATEQTYTAVENGEYAVIITDGECIDTSDCVTINSVGINTDEPINFVIYPNPNNGQFTLDIPVANDIQLVIIDNLGALVYTAELTGNKTQINLDHLAKGMYYIQLTNGVDKTVKKISIQ